MAELIYPEESYRIMGACFNVYNEMGCGFLEPVYQECLEIEFGLQKIAYVAKPELKLHFRDRVLRQTYEPDFVCLDKIIVEIKAVSSLVDDHRAQTLNYLHATKFKLGLLVNFGSYPKLVYERYALTEEGHAQEGRIAR